MSIRVITTVITPATSYDLTSLGNIKDDLAIPSTDTSSDNTLKRYITEQSALVAEYCNRVFPVETVRDSIFPERDTYDCQVPGWQAELQLSRWPVASIASVVETTVVGVSRTLVEGTDFLTDHERGWLTKIDPSTGVPTPWLPDRYDVQYSAGYFVTADPGASPPVAGTPPPADLEMAVLRLVVARFKARGRDPFLKSQGEPNIGTEQYWVGAMPGQTGPFPPDIAAVLEKYRVPLAI